MRRPRRSPALLLAGLCFAAAGLLLRFRVPAPPPDIRLAAIFGEHCVLQAGRSVPIRGWTKPSVPVLVSIAGRTATGLADSSGRFTALLPPLSAGGPYRMTVSAVGERLIVRDVLVGEVWICAGQSNMEFALRDAAGGEQAVRGCTDFGLRRFLVERDVAPTPAEDVRGTWEVSRPAVAGDWSAVGFFFGRELRRARHVPVGLIQAAWGNTAADVWMEPAWLAADPALRPALARWRSYAAAHPDAGPMRTPFAAWIDDIELLPRAGGRPVLVEDFEPRPGRRIPWNAPVTSGEGNTASFSVTVSGRGHVGRFAGVVSMGGWAGLGRWFDADGRAADLSAFRGIRFRARGTGAFRLVVGQPTVTDYAPYRSEPFRLGTEWRTLTVEFRSLSQPAFGRRRPFTPGAVDRMALTIQSPLPWPEQPGSVYHAMIAPLASCPVAGVAWYQGEADVAHAHEYRATLPALIRGWRLDRHAPALPFLVVQLASSGPETAERIPVGRQWAELRDAQDRTCAVLPGTALVVTTDLGEPGNIHPREKAEVGRRLAAAALGGPAGPRFAAMLVAGSVAHLGFSGGAVGAAGGRVTGLTAAGADGVFRPVAGRIEDGGVTVDGGPGLRAVRYGWAANPDGNLVGEDGRPVPPFRTDDWPDATAGSN